MEEIDNFLLELLKLVFDIFTDFQVLLNFCICTDLLSFPATLPSTDTNIILVNSRTNNIILS